MPQENIYFLDKIHQFEFGNKSGTISSLSRTGCT